LAAYATRSQHDKELFKLVNSASASSAMAERAFSVVNLLHSDTRTSMSAVTLEMQVIIRCCLNDVAKREAAGEDALREFFDYMDTIVNSAAQRNAAVKLSEMLVDPCAKDLSPT